MSDSRITIGLGTGRCGTVTLTVFLNMQRSSHVTHERRWRRVRWSGSVREVKRQFDAYEKKLRRGDLSLVGDSAMYYLPYAHFIIERHPNARLICLKRDREATIESFLKKIPGRHPWINHDGTDGYHLGNFDRCLPALGIPDPRKAIGRYWDDYYFVAEELQREHPDHFRIYSTETLNEEAGRAEILSFIGVPKERQILAQPPRSNKMQQVDARKLSWFERAKRRAREEWRWRTGGVFVDHSVDAGADEAASVGDR